MSLKLQRWRLAQRRLKSWVLGCWQMPASRVSVVPYTSVHIYESFGGDSTLLLLIPIQCSRPSPVRESVWVGDHMCQCYNGFPAVIDYKLPKFSPVGPRSSWLLGCFDTSLCINLQYQNNGVIHHLLSDSSSSDLSLLLGHWTRD